MTLALCLLGYSALVCVLGPPILTRLTAHGSVPALGVLAWLTAIAAVLGAWTAAAVALAVQVAHTWDLPMAHLFDDCVVAVHATADGSHGPVAQFAALISALALIGFVAVRGVRVIGAVVRAGRSSARHARSASLVGRRLDDDTGAAAAVVIDAPQRAAYCVAGRPGTVVVTSAAVAALDRPQLAAVLAHEDAHLAGRHHLIRASTRALTTTLPRIPLFAAADDRIAQLLEMCADDRAAGRHSRTAVLTALLTLSGATGDAEIRSLLPDTALGTSTLAVADRVHRLVRADSRTRRAGRGIPLALFAALVAAVPASGYLLVHFGMASCLPFIH
ncbi:peptidase M48 [Nocardia sp. MDA0666]|uniref:M56 family metallopeptidase n=1 Tax=Nocardia sp. MDA0666 TaxID=2135448 RepID=UPI000D13CCB2|nr:M56 family metallopeptidase [Nocardia sp. MDA0666]PSR66436.1 peptidase M48 [Nocardia sp. MDA0666]